MKHARRTGARRGRQRGDPDLMKALHFNEDDLVLNRSGILPDAQKKRMRRSVLKDMMVFLALCGVMLRLLFLPQSRGDYVMEGFCIFSLAIFLWLGIGGYIITVRAARQRIVERVTGTVHVKTTWKGAILLRIGGKEFSVNKSVYGLSAQMTYHVYYAPAANTMVSIESAG